MTGSLAKRSKLVPLSLAMVAAFGGIASYATAVADPLPYGPDTCIQGFVWREAGGGDVVCVTPAVRDSTAQENQLASQRVEPNGGAYGPNTCKQGFVWREAFGGDAVCVTPASRTQAANDNAAAASRKAANAPQPTPAADPCPLGSNPAPGLILPGLGFC
ncbi:MAG: hypothetical protein ACJ74F_08130 [Mycobacterium sp.]|jgi:hypothetical protein|uniref:hypothetical protein n=1 Tax=Mycobacterium sp. TaxID=1785 RepID=UPI0032018A4A